jgi:hypothetical protein
VIEIAWRTKGGGADATDGTKPTGSLRAGGERSVRRSRKRTLGSWMERSGAPRGVIPSERSESRNLYLGPRCRSLDSALRAPLGMTEGERIARRSG